MILPERHLYGIPLQVRSRYVVMLPPLQLPEAGKEALCGVRAGSIMRIGLLVVNPQHLEVVAEIIPGCRFVHMDRGAWENMLSKVFDASCFCAGNVKDCPSTISKLSRDCNNLPFITAVPSKAPVPPIFFVICWPLVSPNIDAIHRALLAISTNFPAGTFNDEAVAEFVAKDVGGSMLDVQEARHLQRRSSFDRTRPYGHGEDKLAQGELRTMQGCAAG